MRFGNLSLIFNEYDFTDKLGTILEGKNDNRLKCRRALDLSMEKLKDLDDQLCLKIDEIIGELMCEYSNIFFTAGFIIGQEFTLTDPRALKEVNLLREQIKKRFFRVFNG